MRRLGLLGLFFIACASGPAPEELGRTSSPIIGGRPSGDDENAAVYIETSNGTEALRCSGRLIAPGLVATARHCLLKRKTSSVKCNADGTPVDIADTTNLSTERPESVTVFVGSNKLAQRKVAVREIIANLEVSLCRGDVGYLVLAERGLEERTPLRRPLAVEGETISVTGWGYVDDDRAALPNTRSTITAKIIEVGPGTIPVGTFTIPGNTLCLGDSGSAALIDGQLTGVYSRIDDPDTCTFEFGRNFVASVMSEPDLLVKAYAAIGEEPWFAGEQKPWLAAPGSACTNDDQCRGGVCLDGACREGCGPTGLACARDNICLPDATCGAPPVSTAPDAGPPPATAASPGDSGGCSHAPARPAPEGGVFIVVVAAALFARRRGITGWTRLFRFRR